MVLTTCLPSSSTSCPCATSIREGRTSLSSHAMVQVRSVKEISKGQINDSIKGNRVDAGPPRLNIPVVNESPSGTKGSKITDSLGNVYSITGGRQISFNGFTDSTTSNAEQLAYVDGNVWYQVIFI
jgi:hypothetical protein